MNKTAGYIPSLAVAAVLGLGYYAYGDASSNQGNDMQLETRIGQDYGRLIRDRFLLQKKQTVAALQNYIKLEIHVISNLIDQFVNGDAASATSYQAGKITGTDTVPMLQDRIGNEIYLERAAR
ncbi:hypothetical protein HZB02_01080 [Candidatus Woesearchaeota archaeon]|nr:hypothetical protein [Candidatus Woesearchaeota archaeon]